MTELRRLLDALPDTATVPVGWVRSKLDGPPEAPEYLSTRQASRYLGYHPKRWRVWCEEGHIEGAWQDTDNGHWRLPLTSCRQHILRRQNRRRGARGPYRKASPAQAARARPSLVQEG